MVKKSVMRINITDIMKKRILNENENFYPCYGKKKKK